MPPFEEGGNFSFYTDDQVLSGLSLTSERQPFVPLHSHMLPICHRGSAETWSIQRALSHHPPYPALPPLGRPRLRPRSLTLMDYFDIHAHCIPLCPSQAIVSIDASSLPMDEKVVYASIGIHPWQLTEANAESQWEALKASVNDPRIIAIGEAGLDKLKGASIPLQTSVFQQEIALSESLSLPMVIHCVRAFNELIQIRKASKAKKSWIMYWYERRGNDRYCSPAEARTSSP